MRIGATAGYSWATDRASVHKQSLAEPLGRTKYIRVNCIV